MRIHGDTLTPIDFRAALQAQKDLGRIARHVQFKTLATHGSRSHATAFEVQLEAGQRDRGRRVGNSGSYGAMRAEADGYAATFDEWGWLLAALFDTDPSMLVGSAKNPIYSGPSSFHERTGWTYAPERLISQIRAMRGVDPFPIVTGQAARTKRGYLIGRRGFGRHDAAYPAHWPHAVRPRTIAEVVAFAWPSGTPSIESEVTR